MLAKIEKQWDNKSYKQRNCPQMFFYPLKYVKDHTTVHFDKIDKNKDSKTPKYFFHLSTLYPSVIRLLKFCLNFYKYIQTHNHSIVYSF